MLHSMQLSDFVMLCVCVGCHCMSGLSKVTGKPGANIHPLINLSFPGGHSHCKHKRRDELEDGPPHCPCLNC